MTVLLNYATALEGMQERGVKKVWKHRSRLDLELIFHGSGVLRVRIEGLFGEGNTVLPVNKYYG
jgi:hypothetical protein